MSNYQTNSREKKTSIDSIVEGIYEEMPEFLYKYSDLNGPKKEYMKDLITKGKLYFAAPSQFNDPLDCRVSISFEASTLKRKYYWKSLVQKYAENLPIEERKRIIKQKIRELRTPEGREQFKKNHYEYLNQNGIACFSANPTSLLLWSYYSDGHKGISVRFNMDDELLTKIPFRLLPLKVQYQKDFPSINLYEYGQDQIVITSFGTKSYEWKHEEEWRFITLKEQGLLQIPPQLINGVILGMRIDPEMEKEIRDWIRSCSHHIKLSRIEHRQNSYELQIVDV